MVMTINPTAKAAPRLVYLVTEDWYFLSHRLPMAKAAQRTDCRNRMVPLTKNVPDQ